MTTTHPAKQAAKNEGAKHRKQDGISNIYRWLKKNDYPTGSQTLCFNCNVKKHLEVVRTRRKQ